MGVTRLLTECFVIRVGIFEVLPFPAWDFTGPGDFDLMWASRYLCLVPECSFFITGSGVGDSPYNGSFFGDELPCLRLSQVGDGVLTIL